MALYQLTYTFILESVFFGITRILGTQF